VIRAVAAITGKDLRERLRDKSFFLLGILTPLVLAFVLNLVFGGLEEGEFEVRLGVTDVDQSDISALLHGNVLGLDGAGGLEVTDVPATTDADAAVDDEGLDAVLVIPSGFGADLTSPQSAAPQLQLIENPDRPVQAGIAGSVADGLTAELRRNQLVLTAGESLEIEAALDAAVDDIELIRQFPGGEGLGVGARMLAGMAIMFVLFTVQFGVTTLLNEKQDGTLTRLLAAPIPRSSITAAKGLVGFVLGVLSTMTLMVAGTFLLGAEWGSWFGVTLLVVAAVLTAVALMAIVAGIATTAEGAGGAQAIIAVGLAMLGGSWFPIPDEGLIGAASRLTPHYWFLSGLEDLADADSWTVVGTPVAVLVVIAVVAGVPAAVLLQRKLTP
jgi:ABC-2 type transport system permease protein